MGEVKNGLYHPLSHLSADLLAASSAKSVLVLPAGLSQVNIPIWFLLALAAILPATLILDSTVPRVRKS